MNPTSLHNSATGGRGRRLAFASAVSALALVGAVGLGFTHSGAQAQLKADFGADALWSCAAVLCRYRRSRQTGCGQHPGHQWRRQGGGQAPRAARAVAVRKAFLRPARRQPLLRVLQELAEGVARPARRRRGPRRPRAPASSSRLTATSSPTTTSSTAPARSRSASTQDNKYRGGADRHRPAHRHRAAQDQGGVEPFPFVKFSDKTAARRRLGAGGRQPLRSRRHGDGRHRLGARPRHRLGPLRLHADRRGREPRQLRRPDLQPRRRSGRRQHRHLQPVGRQRRHRLRHSRQDRDRGGRRSSRPAAPSTAAGSASRSRTSTRIRRRASGCTSPRARSSAKSPPGPRGRGRPQERRRHPVASTATRSPTAATSPGRSPASRPAPRSTCASCAARRSRPSPSSSARSRPARSWPRSRPASPSRAADDRDRSARPDAWPPAPAPTRTAW